jgi:hypothetical protein
VDTWGATAQAGEPGLCRHFQEARYRDSGQTPVVDPKRLQKQLSGIEAKLAKAKRRLLEVGTDMLPTVQEHIRELRRQQEQLQATLRTAQTPPERIYDDVDTKIDKAMQRFSTYLTR